MTTPITYDREAFYEALGQVRGLLAELRYIDRALAYLREQRITLGEEFWAGHVSFQIELGRTAPFTRWCSVPDPVPLPWEGLPWHTNAKETEVRAQLAELAGEAETWAAAEISSLTERIAPLTEPIADRYESRLIRPLETVHDTLSYEVSSDVGKLAHSLGGWEGAAADSFASHFYHPFGDILRRQRELLTALAAGLAAAKAIVESTQHSLMDVVHQVRDLLHAQLQQRAEDAGPGREAARTAVIISAGAGVLAAVASGGGLWTVGLTAFAGATSVAATGVPDEAATDHQLAGSTAEELLAALTNAVVLVDTNESDQHDELAEAIRAVLERVASLRGDGSDDRLIPIRPDLVDGVDASNFYLP
ncbi:MAG: hypothetical protein ACRDT2_16715 [Natronosporangium sp.]